MEIIFVSSDRDQSSFDGYYAKMDFLALPHSERAKESELSKKYGVRGIPTLVILGGKSGKVIAKDVRSAVLGDNPREIVQGWAGKDMFSSGF
jgi:nucleoredoxin